MKGSNRKIQITIIFSIIVIAVFILIYFHFKNEPPGKISLLPKAELSSVQVTSINDEGTDLTINLFVKNPLPVNFKFDSIQYQIFIGDTAIIKGSYRDSILIKSKDSTTVLLKGTLKKNQYLSILNRADSNRIDSVNYEVSAVLFSQNALVKKIHVHYKKLSPLIHIPVVRVNKTKLDSISTKGATLLLYVSVTNKNSYDFEARKIKFRFAPGKNKWVTGTKPELLVKAKSTTETVLPLKITLDEMSNAIFLWLTKGKSVDYKMEIEFEMISDKKFLDGCIVKIKSEGTVGQIEKKLEKNKKLASAKSD